VKEFIIKKKIELLAYLKEALPSWSKKKIKQYLSHGSVLVNGKERTKYNYVLRAGDIVSVSSKEWAITRQLLTESFIYPVYDDNDLIVVNKPPGLLTISNETTYSNTLYFKVTDYVRAASGTRESRIFVVHRLDEDVSGLIVFAKTEQSKRELQNNWDTVIKKYYAVVEGCPKEKYGEIKSYLEEDDSFRVRSVTKSDQGKIAITRYRILKVISDCSLLEVRLITGRKNQIRVHLSEMGCPIIGDKKYGAKTNPVKRMGLHAYFLSFMHPVTKKKMVFQTEMPEKLNRMLLSDVKMA